MPRSLALVFLILASTPAAASDSALIAKGKQDFLMKGCSGCHTIGEGDRSGPDLKGVFERRKEPWVEAWIKNPDAAFEKKDPIALELLGKFNMKMPVLGLTDEEIKEVVAYLKAASAAHHGHIAKTKKHN